MLSSRSISQARRSLDPTVYINEIDNYIYLRDESEDEHEEHGDDHGGLILANYVQQDAEFTGYEFEIGRVFELGGGDLTLSYGLDSVSQTSRTIAMSQELIPIEASTKPPMRGAHLI